MIGLMGGFTGRNGAEANAQGPRLPYGSDRVGRKAARSAWLQIVRPGDGEAAVTEGWKSMRSDASAAKCIWANRTYVSLRRNYQKRIADCKGRGREHHPCQALQAMVRKGLQTRLRRTSGPPSILRSPDTLVSKLGPGRENTAWRSLIFPWQGTCPRPNSHTTQSGARRKDISVNRSKKYEGLRAWLCQDPSTRGEFTEKIARCEPGPCAGAKAVPRYVVRLDQCG